MFRHYEDILTRIAEAPRWFDEFGVPRYCEFAPDQIAHIYARECALVAIECQSCGHPFLVALNQGTANQRLLSRIGGQQTPWRDLAAIIRSHEIHYGDPPNVGCCEEGLTQNSIPRRVVEYWRRDSSGWQRDKSLEIEIPES